MTSAHERWTQRMLGGLGARPAGHAAPHEEPADGPQIPAQSPLPPPAAPPRVTPWWETGRPHIGAAPDPAPAEEQEDEEGQEPEPVSKEAPAAPAPAVDAAGTEQTDDDKRTVVRIVMGGAVEDRNMRVIMFNLTAGGVGYGLGIVRNLGTLLPAAEHGALGVFGLFTAAAGAVAAWRLTRFPAVQHILPVPPLSRCVIAVGAAEIGRQLAPVPVAWLNQHGERFGLGPSAISLLLTAGVMCGGIWWFLDRRIRHWHWTARWVLRIPLASALLATGLYAPGVHA